MPKRKKSVPAKAAAKRKQDPEIVVQVVAHSEPFYSHNGVSYFHSLTVQFRMPDEDDSILQAKINADDVIAIQHDAGQTLQPFNKQPWIIGHVLAFGSRDGQYSVVYRQMLRLQREAKLLLNEETLKKCKTDTRIQSSLLETNLVNYVNVTSILPALIEMKRLVANKEPKPVAIFSDWAYSIGYYCRHRAGKMNTCVMAEYWGEETNSSINSTQIEKGWQDWQASDTVPFADSGCDTKAVILKAQTSYRDETHEQLKERWRGISNLEIIQLYDNDEIEESKPSGHDEIDENDDQLSTTGVAPDTTRRKARAKRAATTKKSPAKARQSKKVKLNAEPQNVDMSIADDSNTMSKETINSSTAWDVAPSLSSNDHTTVYTESAGADSLHSSSATKKRLHKGNTTDESSHDYSAIEENSNVYNADDYSVDWPKLNVKPGPVLCVHKRPKEKTKLLKFIEGVQLDYDSRYCKKPKKHIRWEIRVGDLVAVRLKSVEATTSSTNPLFANFRGPWSPGQIVSMYTKNEDEKIYSQVRWFHLPHELPESTKRFMKEAAPELVGPKSRFMVVEIDEMVGEVPIHTIIGKLNITSESIMPSATSQIQNFDHQIPTISLICKYGLRVKDDNYGLDNVKDWTNYWRQLAGPLSRGLLCPKCYTGKIKNLQDVYAKRLRKRLGLPPKDKVALFLHDSDYFTPVKPKEETTLRVYWSNVDVDCTSVGVDELTSLSGYTYYKSAELTINQHRFSARATSIKSAKDKWKYTVGDIVTVIDPDSINSVMSGESNADTKWYPFTGPWKYAQIIAIYRKSRRDALQLEVRWFCRLDDVPDEYRNYISKSGKPYKGEKEYIIESDRVQSGLQANLVLGSANILMHPKKVNVKRMVTDHSTLPVMVPIVDCCCNAFYSEKWQTICFLESSDHKTLIYQRSHRNIQLASNTEYAKRVIKLLLTQDKYRLSNEQVVAADTLSSADETEYRNQCYLSNASKNLCRIYYTHSNFVSKLDSHAEIFGKYSGTERHSMRWTTAIGGIVAVKALPREYTLQAKFPYTENWSVCQVIALYTEERVDTKQHADKPSQYILVQAFTPGASSDNGREVMHRDSANLYTVSASDIVGPVELVVNDIGTSVKFYRSTGDDFYPVTCMCLYDLGSVSSPNMRSRDSLIHHLYTSAVNSCDDYSDKEKELMVTIYNDLVTKTRVKDSLQIGNIDTADLDYINAENGNNEGSSDGSTTSSEEYANEVTKVGSLLYNDSNAGRKYYDTIHITIPYRQYCKELKLPGRDDSASWQIKVGDIAVLHVNHNFTGRAIFGVGLDNRASNFPLSIAWSVAEVVAIWQDSDKDWCIEVRWYYRRFELPDTHATKPEFDVNVMEEIFESDHYSTCSIESLVCPVAIHDEPGTISKTLTRNGMPVLEFYSKRLWSPHRKLLIPHSGIISRMNRCLIGASTMNSSHALKEATMSCIGIEVAEKRVRESVVSTKATDWQVSYANIIETLSLTDASKKAYKSSTKIIGRDVEKEQIKSFVVAAINAKQQRDSIFVTGPPGVGKTATIQAVMSDMLAESNKRKKLVRLLTINGLEMQSPLVAYTKLWELICAEQLSAKVAKEKLKKYFTEKSRDGAKTQTIVLMLDEIDYLFTKKDSVLQQIFSWPEMAREGRSTNRLVVIGISNTIHLPEQMHGRLASRIGTETCCFNAYTSDQITNILTVKLEEASPVTTIFCPEAIRFVAKKTAFESGDLRKAFTYCRHAAEHVLQKHDDVEDKTIFPPLIKIKDILHVTAQSEKDPVFIALRYCSIFEALFMVALLSLARVTGRESGYFDLTALMIKMESMTNEVGDPRYTPSPNFDETICLLTQLSQAGFVTLNMDRNADVAQTSEMVGCSGPWPTVKACVDNTLLYLALKGTMHAKIANLYLLQKR